MFGYFLLLRLQPVIVRLFIFNLLASSASLVLYSSDGTTPLFPLKVLYYFSRAPSNRVVHFYVTLLLAGGFLVRPPFPNQDIVTTDEPGHGVFRVAWLLQ